MISLLGATNQSAPNVIQKLIWKEMGMKHLPPKIENGMPLELRAIDVKFTKQFKGFQGTIIQ